MPSRKQSSLYGSSAGDRGAAQVAGPGEDDVLEPLHGRGGDRRIDPLAVGPSLARRGDAQRVRAQVAVEDDGGHLDALAGILRVRIPFGGDDAAVGIALGERG